MSEKICKQCKKVFYIKPSWVKMKGRGTFCSMICRRKWERLHTHINIECEICKKIFHLQKSKTKRGWGKFCSRKCFYIYLGKKMTGENSPNFTSIKVKCCICNKEVYREPNEFKKHKVFYCSRECQHYVNVKYGGRKQYVRFHHQRRKALIRNGGELSVKTIQLVYEDNIKKYGTLTCYLCLKTILFGKDQLEHKTPLNRGGTNEYNNLGVACQSCNSSKRTKTVTEFRRYIYEKNS